MCLLFRSLSCSLHRAEKQYLCIYIYSIKHAEMHGNFHVTIRMLMPLISPHAVSNDFLATQPSEIDGVHCLQLYCPCCFITISGWSSRGSFTLSFSCSVPLFIAWPIVFSDFTELSFSISIYALQLTQSHKGPPTLHELQHYLLLHQFLLVLFTTASRVVKLSAKPAPISWITVSKVHMCNL